MKHLFILFAFLPFASSSQEFKDSKITVTDSSLTFDKLVSLLEAQQYRVQFKESRSGFVSTKSRRMEGNDGTPAAFKFRLSGTTVSIIGEVMLVDKFDNRSGNTFYPITYGGSKNSGMVAAWTEMDRLAKLLGSAITYSKREKTDY